MALTAGPVTAELEPSSGFLRYVRLGDRELLRGCAAVRNHNRGTVAPIIRDLETHVESDRFAVRFVPECREGALELRWQGEIRGEADGIAAASDARPLIEAETSRLRALRPAHLRVDVEPGEAHFEERLVRSDREAEAMGADLELVVHLTDAAQSS